MPSTEPNSKVLFRIPNDDGSSDVETLWATPIGNDKFQIDNSPFYAYSVSWKDIVFAPFNADEELPTFVEVVEKSGHKTVRIIFDPPVEDGNKSDKILEGLVDLGCSYEGANPKYMSIDIPPNIDLSVVREYLITANAQWEHADPRYSELFPNDN